MTHPEASSQRKELGPYQLGLLLGRGGMGEVYKAFDDRLGRWVAVKRLRGDATPAARKRFRREARTLAQLGHPGIVRIFDVVEDEAGDWIVMELVDGPTLAELRRGGPLDVGLALDYGRQIASALEAAHASGIVHRDLKTENVMVLPSGHTKVLDFGLARRVAPMSDETFAAADTALSLPGGIAGTPRTMSPEQALGRDVDARSDLFSFGVLLYEILTARLPFVAGTVQEVLRRVILHYPPPARQLNPKVPQELSDLVDALLEKDPAHRRQTAAAVESELVKIAAGNRVYHVTSHGLSDVETLGLTQVEPADPQTSEDETCPEDAVVTTLLVSDLVGSTRLVEELGDREATALFRRHDRLARDLLEEHGGREIDKTDGFFCLFDRPWNAVRYALAYHDGLRELDLAARVGIHLGEVILHRNTPRDVERGAKPVEVEGLAKPTAARLMSLAASAQTLLTRAAYEVARRSAASENDRRVEWRSHGRYRFRGIGDDVEVFEVGVPGAAPLTAPPGSEKAHRLDDATAGSAPVTSRGLRAPSVTALRSWPPPEIPEQPYPVLLPYTHPDFLAGRDAEIARLRRLLEAPVPILGLSAPSGTGKSSLLVGGLVPTLRAAGLPVALVRHPAEAGVASRLIGDLLDGTEPVADHDAAGFVERLAEVERLAGKAPVLVLDQLDDVLDERASIARGILGILMAASVARRPGLGTPLCRWLIAYRQELYGRLSLWLGDALADARREGAAGIEPSSVQALPHDLSQPERFHSMTLPPLATPPPGGREALAESTRVFLAAIEKPLKLSEGRWHFPHDQAERLARAFAEARLARPDAPLAPELQVVLAHLLAEAGADGRVHVPDDPGPLIDDALDDHLRRALEMAFPADTAESSRRRARALLALRELATTTGRRDEGLRGDDLARAIGDDGEAILAKLATPLTRLVVVRETPTGPRWMLAHDRMAEAIVRLVEEEGRHGQLVIDTELLALRRFVTLRTALYRSREVKTSTTVPRRHFQRIEENAEALLWNDERRAWFAACRRRRGAERRRLAGLVTVAVLVLALVGWGTWAWAHRLAEHRALLEQVVRGEPDAALQALDDLARRPDADFEELLALLRQRESPMDVLERGLGGLDGPERSAAVLRAVEIALPWVKETPKDPVLLANLVWALDYAPGRDPTFADRARSLRDRVLAPLRQLRPPPPLPELDDPDWIHIPAGSFLMGTGPDEEGDDDERPQHEVTVSAFRMQRHEVTNAEYRRLVHDHDPDAAEDLPAALVTWYAAYTYAAWLGGRLPTEAEWEYAARAGCPYAYCTRDGRETTVDAVAWTLRSSRNAAGKAATPLIMQLEPNPWGLHDMLGNLWEWAADVYAEYSVDPRATGHGAGKRGVDGTVPSQVKHAPWGPTTADGGRRVIRGGSFKQSAERSRVTYRNGVAPNSRDDVLGFRVIFPRSSALTLRLFACGSSTSLFSTIRKC